MCSCLHRMAWQHGHWWRTPMRSTRCVRTHAPPSLQQPVATRFQHLDDQNDEAAHAQQIVKELYHRYEKQQQRWRDYRTLFAFLAFIAW